MMQQAQGIYGLLCYLLTWVVMGGMFVAISVVLIGKVLRGERLSSHLWACSYAGPIMVVFLAIGILKRGTIFFVPFYHLQFGWCHWAILAAMVGVGVLACYVSDENRLVEVFRNVVVDPTLIFLLITLVPIIYANGTFGAKTITCISVLIWGIPSLVRIVVGLHRLQEEKTQRYHYNPAWFDL